MSIKTVNDLQNNQEYYVCLIPKGRAVKSKYLGCVKTNASPDFYFKILEGQLGKDTIHFQGINEIGIGTTKEEAKQNFGKIPIELPTVHFDDKKQIPGLENWPYYIQTHQ